PRFFVPEHGTMFTLALVRFPPTATKEIQYLNAKGALTYTDIAGDPVLYGNLPPRPVSSWKALNLRKTLLMASSVRLKPLNCSRLPCVYAQETLTFLLTQKKTSVKNYVQKERSNV